MSGLQRLAGGAARLQCTCGLAERAVPYPGFGVQEKCDHIGIVALIAGTPLTAAMVSTA